MSMPPFFPLVRPGCEDVAKDFFQCFDKQNEPFGDADAAMKAMSECAPKQASYEQCTEKSLKTGAKTMIATSYELK